MSSLKHKVAWVTGAGSGIGRAGALALAGAGAHVVLSGRGREPLEETASLIAAGGGSATLEPVDVRDAGAVGVAAERIGAEHSRLDILVNSAGLNIPVRHWSEVRPEGWAQVVDTNLSGAAYCIAAALPLMRARRDGLVINISSWAGRFDGYLTGPAYSASKHGVLSLNASLNIEECVNGIRGCAICPAEVATPIMKKRPTPPSDEDLARMLRPEDLGRTILFVALLPPHVCMNEILISPTWNRLYIGGDDLKREP